MVPTEPQPPTGEDESERGSAAEVETVQGDVDQEAVSSWLAEMAHAPPLQPRKTRRLKEGDILADRYVVRKVLGAGGMGVVYEASDTKLQRSVALKTHQCGGERARLKLIAEARAMAKLSHPHVVAVHDVGEFADGVFLAADLVRGTTLRDWDVAKAGWRETVRVYSNAGRGLAAAHALQLVHRDFKPENVLLDAEGRCYVTDFGLAALLGETAEAPSFSGEETISVERAKASTSRGWAGTPSYMAPEQFLRGRVDARSDQFSFCVALYEALFGARPFGTTSLTLPAGGITGAPPNTAVKVPRRVHRALGRGLQPEATARFPSMDALLTELDAAVRPKRTLSLAAAVLGGAGALLGGWSLLSEQESCELGDAPLSAWDAGIRSELEASFAGSTDAERSWPAVVRSLEAYALDWRSSWREACLARGSATPQVTVATFRCLEDSQRDFDATLRRFGTGSHRVRANGLSRIARLLQPAECLDPRFVEAAPVRLSPPYASVVEGIRESLRAVREDVGGDASVASLQARLKELRRHVDLVRDSALEAEYRWTEVTVELRREPASALGPLKLAYHRAREGGEPNVAVQAAATLGRLLAYDLGKPEAGLVWAEVASAEARQDGVSLAMAIEAELALAIAYDTAGLWTEAGAAYDAALEQAGRLPPETAAYTRAGILISVSGFESVRGDTEAALTAGHEAVATFLDIYGGPSRESLNANTNIGLALHDAQRYDEAKALFVQEYRDRTLLLGADDVSCIPVLINLGLVESALRNDAEARRYYADADRVVVKHFGEHHPDRALIATNLAYVESRAGNEEAAKQMEERAVATLVASMGATAEPTLLARLALAGSSRRLGELDVPCASYDDVAALARQSLGATRVLARALAGQGDCAQAQGDFKRAEELLRAGLKISAEVSDAPELRAVAERRLGGVILSVRPSAVAEAREWMEGALRHFEAGPGNEADIERAKRWLAEHPASDPSLTPE